MVENGHLEALDINGNPLMVGAAVRYLNTGTTGRVLDIKKDDEGIWAQIDTTGLYYIVDVLLIIDPGELKEKKEAEKGMDAEAYAQSYSQRDSQAVDIGQVTGGG
ncbi:DUF2098 domain-containing protein [Methanolobus sp.]|uniref:DUF2098 domain-containing protein n=1 Tax=Methanolobus sp. TaxID=1874737 RepID=UPI0025E4394C|nr:DUF2098 domain-containing protein [Methanolobus sp.]